MSLEDAVSEHVPDDEELTYVRWARALRAGDLLGQQCADCDAVFGVPKSVCPECHGQSLGAVALPTSGEVFSETTIGVTPEGLDDKYQVAVVDLGETRILARVGGDASIGDTVTFEGIVEFDDMPGPLFE
jgi:uncharacterized OB-fold protein